MVVPHARTRASPRPRAPATRRRWRVLGLVALVAAHAWLRGPIAAALSPAALPSASSEHLRIATWNLRRLGAADAHTDLERLHAELRRLDADLIALQEIVDAAPLARPFEGWSLRLSEAGGHGEQHLGFAWRPDRLRARGPLLVDAVSSMGGRYRPVVAQRFDSPAGPLLAVTVHLKARPEGREIRRQQVARLRTWIQSRLRADETLILLGDFNLTGGAEARDAGAERREMIAQLAALNVKPVPNPLGCSAYWDGPQRDAWREPSELDLMWVPRALARSRVHPGAHCSRHSCQSFRSTPAYPDLDYRGISDHCPVVFDLPIEHAADASARRSNERHL